MLYSIQEYLRIGPYLACVYRVVDARGKFGEHERNVRVARDAVERCKTRCCVNTLRVLYCMTRKVSGHLTSCSELIEFSDNLKRDGTLKAIFEVVA